MKLPGICLSLLGLSSFSALAGTMGAPVPVETWYLTGGGGGSMSRTVHIKTDPAVWDFAIEGYSNDMRSAGIAFFGVGRYLMPYLRLDARFEHRSKYHYTKLQTGSSNTPNFTSSLRKREFDLESNVLMGSAWLDLGDLWQQFLWTYHDMAFQPFVGAGLGIDYLTVTNFKTDTNPGGPRPVSIRSDNPLSNGNRFTWHVGAGLEGKISERTTLAAGYNYFDGGSIPFPNYLFTPVNFTASTHSWKGRFTANEVYGEIRVIF